MRKYSTRCTRSGHNTISESSTPTGRPESNERQGRESSVGKTSVFHPSKKKKSPIETAIKRMMNHLGWEWEPRTGMRETRILEKLHIVGGLALQRLQSSRQLINRSGIEGRTSRHGRRRGTGYGTGGALLDLINPIHRTLGHGTGIPTFPTGGGLRPGNELEGTAVGAIRELHRDTPPTSRTLTAPLAGTIGTLILPES